MFVLLITFIINLLLIVQRTKKSWVQIFSSKTDIENKQVVTNGEREGGSGNIGVGH